MIKLKYVRFFKGQFGAASRPPAKIGACVKLILGGMSEKMTFFGNVKKCPKNAVFVRASRVQKM